MTPTSCPDPWHDTPAPADALPDAPKAHTYGIDPLGNVAPEPPRESFRRNVPNTDSPEGFAYVPAPEPPRPEDRRLDRARRNALAAANAIDGVRRPPTRLLQAFIDAIAELDVAYTQALDAERARADRAEAALRDVRDWLRNYKRSGNATDLAAARAVIIHATSTHASAGGGDRPPHPGRR